MIFKKIALAFVLAGMIGGSKTVKADSKFENLAKLISIVVAAKMATSFVVLSKTISNIAKENPELSKKECLKQGFAEWKKNSNVGYVVPITAAIIGVISCLGTEVGLNFLSQKLSDPENEEYSSFGSHSSKRAY